MRPGWMPHFSCSWIALASGVPLAVVALVLSLQPVLTALLAPRLAGQKVAGRVWAGLVLGLAGAAVVILSRGEIGAFPLPALLIVFGALAAFTTATLLDRRFGGKHHPVAVNTIQFAVAAACTVPMAILLEGFRFDLTVGLVAAVGYLAVGTSLVALSLFLVMVRYGEAARVASLLYLVPPIAALLGWVFLGQAVPPVLWGGMALASAGVWLAMRAPPAEPVTRARP